MSDDVKYSVAQKESSSAWVFLTQTANYCTDTQKQLQSSNAPIQEGQLFLKQDSWKLFVEVWKQNFMPC